jgi:tetratricopeptide (TPR) repeat protein
VLNRGLLHLQQRHYTDAAADLQRALKLGAAPGTVYYDLALVELARHNRSEASAYARRALDYSPAHRQARQLVEKLDNLGKK